MFLVRLADMSVGQKETGQKQTGQKDGQTCQDWDLLVHSDWNIIAKRILESYDQNYRIDKVSTQVFVFINKLLKMSPYIEPSMVDELKQVQSEIRETLLSR